MENFKINSIYRATEGEGVNLGTPLVFVRFQGCAVGCINCDSQETWAFDDGKVMKLSAILSEIETLSFNGKIRWVSITGGDPQHPLNLTCATTLATELKKRNFLVNIESAGMTFSEELFDCVDFISVDYKTPSTGVCGNLQVLEKIIAKYPNKFQIKSVIQTREDFDNTLIALEAFKTSMIPWVLTPAYNENEKFPKERFINIIKWNELAGGPFRVIGQQHKWLFGPDEKLV